MQNLLEIYKLIYQTSDKYMKENFFNLRLCLIKNFPVIYEFKSSLHKTIVVTQKPVGKVSAALVLSYDPHHIWVTLLMIALA